MEKVETSQKKPEETDYATEETNELVHTRPPAEVLDCKI